MASFRIICASIVVTFCVACGNPLGGDRSVADSDHQPGLPEANQLQPAAGTEFISSSAQQVLTLSGNFKVESSLGGAFNQIQGTTTGGYFYYLNVQGQIVSN